MSTDFDAVCDTCKLVVHAGQIMAGLPSFGHGSNDADGRRAVAAWLFEHARHGEGPRIVVDHTAPGAFEGYEHIDFDE